MMFSFVIIFSIPSAYSTNGHGSSFGPEFGGGKLVKYSDGLTINGETFDISKHSQTIPTQKIFTNKPLEIDLKMYHTRGPQYIQHVVVFFNTKGNNPQPSQSDTWIEFDKNSGVSTHDPNKIFGNVSAKTIFDSKFMHLNLTAKIQKSIDTSNIIIRAWDKNKATSEVDVLNAINIAKILGSYSTIS